MSKEEEHHRRAYVDVGHKDRRNGNGNGWTVKAVLGGIVGVLVFFGGRVAESQIRDALKMLTETHDTVIELKTEVKTLKTRMDAWEHERPDSALAREDARKIDDVRRDVDRIDNEQKRRAPVVDRALRRGGP